MIAGDAAMAPPVLKTARLVLRPVVWSDTGLIGHYTRDAALARMTHSIPHPLPPGATERFVERILAGETDEVVRAIDHAASEENGLIGLIAVKPDGEIGYWVGAPFWSTGFATEAVEAVVAHEMATGRERLSAEVFQDNPASAKVLTKAGFAFVGEGRTYSVAREAEVATWRYALERWAWNQA